MLGNSSKQSKSASKGVSFDDALNDSYHASFFFAKTPSIQPIHPSTHTRRRNQVAPLQFREMSSSAAVGETNLSVLLKSMKPTLNEGEYIFTTLPNEGFDSLNIPRSDTVCEFKEMEGVTIVMEKSKAANYSLKFESTYAWITLEIHSSLDAVGLTAAFSNELANEEISCNVIAGYYHDHIFVGVKDGLKSIEILKKLAAKQP